MRCLEFAVMVVALSVCFVGCNFNSGGNSGSGDSTSSDTVKDIRVIGD